ncbi:MAG TPA: hypothetical protein VMO26_06935 [Vicinamibacterales bacterium]|nr:hypothetical protein [Vicinamibacterales bacterium]
MLVAVGDAPFPVLAKNFVDTAGEIRAFVAAQPRPFIAKVKRPAAADLARNPAAHGSVTLWWPK